LSDKDAAEISPQRFFSPLKICIALIFFLNSSHSNKLLSCKKVVKLTYFYKVADIQQQEPYGKSLWHSATH